MTRPVTEMEMRVAKALYDLRHDDCEAVRSVAVPTWDELPDDKGGDFGRLDWIIKARAAIRAMREPTQDTACSVYTEAVEALAEVWASIDGRLEEFIQERSIANGRFATTDVVMGGHYAGYLEEARAAIERLRKRGFHVLPVRTNVAKLQGA